MSFRFLRPDSDSVWKNSEIKQRFSRYRSIIDNKSFSRFILAKVLECNFDSDDQLDTLQELHKEKSEEFQDLLELDNSQLKKRTTFDSNYLTLNHRIAERYLEDCIFCERKCNVNRIDEEKGFCLVSDKSFIASAFLHYGEESVLVPSGTIFFQGCNFGCVFCQNYDISQSWKSKRDISETARSINARELSEVADRLVSKGALNINYVGGDPIPNIHTIIENLIYQTKNVCQLWNSNFYLTNESLLLLVDLMDFWLPDFKYGCNDCGKKYSGIDNYFDILKRNLKRIHDDGSGEIIIRHLVMPNHVECCSKPIMDFIANEVPKCAVNIMGQYRPEYHAYKFDEINRRPSAEEMREVKQYADKLGVLWEPVS